MTHDGAGRESAEVSGFDVREAAAALAGRISVDPRVHLVLGSGLGGLAGAVEEGVSIPFRELPGLPATGVVGHEGRYLTGLLEGVPVLVQAGRYHFYEGHPREVVVAPIRIGAALGIEVLFLTNAAGGIDPRLEPGSILLADDHVNLQFRSPLAGPAREGEPRFPDMSAPYDPGLQELALDAAAEAGVVLRRGVYCAVLGPSFETPAEIAMLERLGGDAVGMSTVPEVICARARGLRVLALSLISNPAAGRSPRPLSHDEVRAVADRAAGRVEAVIRGVLRRLDR
ncbi:MAG: purine-nucleoside phosphorylase [Gemmatimonadetes bacterium]|nr:purine-nucleoside phosphorylase [Gemmatimonadota bacterium]NIP81454.1 purine-nucleoside phosphorylase [Gemmatimonadota bacterium]NIR78227.1 purine-nucleoside phosphorylase [Gemmatimonadota bacterium]NIV61031.1 purine-nucleoside phosphorylase [Gemmatimonadota bacterium]NIX46369.1 purine-nucleoside phosphorylase [Gemmatimonadota bacterium]